MPETIRAIVPIAFTYKNRAGKFIQRYLDGLKEAKILGAKCPSCGNVYVPPRSACGRCAAEITITDVVEVGPEGVVEELTVAHVKVEAGELKKLDSPQVLAMIKLEGASSTILVPVLNDPEKVKPGVRVKPVWAEERSGEYSDLKGFEIIE